MWVHECAILCLWMNVSVCMRASVYGYTSERGCALANSQVCKCTWVQVWLCAKECERVCETMLVKCLWVHASVRACECVRVWKCKNVSVEGWKCERDALTLASASACREAVRLCYCECLYKYVRVSVYARVSEHSSCVFYELHRTKTNNRKNLNLWLSKVENKNKLLNSTKRWELLDNVERFLLCKFEQNTSQDLQSTKNFIQ